MFAGGEGKKGKIISQQGVFEETLNCKQTEALQSHNGYELPMPTYGPSISDMHSGYNFSV